MPAIQVLLDIAEAGKVLSGRYVVQTQRDITISPLPGGMVSGKTSVSIIIPLDDEEVEKLKAAEGPTVLFAETSLNAWMQATALMRGAFQDEVDQPGYAVVPEPVKQHLIPIYAEMIRRVCRVKIGKITKEMSEELAAAFIDGLASGAPPSAFGEHHFNG